MDGTGRDGYSLFCSIHSDGSGLVKPFSSSSLHIFFFTFSLFPIPRPDFPFENSPCPSLVPLSPPSSLPTRNKKDRVELTVPYLKFFFFCLVSNGQRSVVACLALPRGIVGCITPRLKLSRPTNNRLNASFYVGAISFWGIMMIRRGHFTYNSIQWYTDP